MSCPCHSFSDKKHEKFNSHLRESKGPRVFLCILMLKCPNKQKVFIWLFFSDLIMGENGLGKLVFFLTMFNCFKKNQILVHYRYFQMFTVIVSLFMLTCR